MRLRVSDRAPDVALEGVDGGRLECSRPGAPAVVLFTRYAGCPVCQLEVARIASAMPEFRARSCGVWMVFQSTAEHLRAAMAEWKPGFAAVADPTAHLYEAFGVEASVAGYLAPGSLLALVRATMAGKRHGRFEGRETQLPAGFVLDPTGRIALAHYGRSVGDDAPVSALLGALDSLNNGADQRVRPVP
ncbi:alkyl hydroperoxide reductase/ Thiol specific antioxidant/ Mal allergen [Anaeromyxobacter dehalogenans 2CP-1]|uniref:Alkyl hydroperoxide reductase/ Thiol specific antioxidant/ Mal allergen n=1 Tax=Anaeromyxobacter dehalogenans (strain ATCC BAA-258 / DSM 21875 / 2CP-1) TaxID=455488 RepID=B8J9H9_ANAD2|nr:peroxiredoxin-like family protein [Anaeromyxobacter dehalogenans]ACL67367.1 alkyl hydroperoxide reductase/ Thiol specific antioxidant/ Mal allergen [Anaeromyxobacter dehalogenans 2CP-1]